MADDDAKGDTQHMACSTESMLSAERAKALEKLHGDLDAIAVRLREVARVLAALKAQQDARR